MSAKGISSIEEVSKELKKKGVAVSDEALSVIIETAFSEFIGHIVKLNKTVTKLGKNVAKLTKVQSNMEKLLAEKKLADEEKERLKEKIRAKMIKGNREKIGKGAVPDGDVAIIQNAVKEKIDSAGLDRMSPKKFAQAVDAVLSGRFAKKGRVKLLLGDNGNNIASIDVSLGGSAILESQKIGIRDVNKIQPKMDKIEEEPEAENQDENEMIL